MAHFFLCAWRTSPGEQRWSCKDHGGRGGAPFEKITAGPPPASLTGRDNLVRGRLSVPLFWGGAYANPVASPWRVTARATVVTHGKVSVVSAHMVRRGLKGRAGPPETVRPRNSAYNAKPWAAERDSLCVEKRI